MKYLMILEFNLAWFALWVDFYKRVYFWQYSYFPLNPNIYLEIHFNAPLGPLAGWCQLRSALDRVNDVDVGSLSSSSRPWGSRSNLEEPGQSCLEILDVGPPILLTSSGIDHKVGCVLPTKHKNVWEHYYLLSAQYSNEWLFAIWTFLHTKSIHCNIFNKENGFLRETQFLPGTSRGWSKPDLSRLLSPGQRRKILVQQKQCSRNSSQTGSKSFSSPYSGFVFLSQVFWNWFKVGGKLV